MEIKKEYNRKETVVVLYENVLFTDLSSKNIKNILEYGFYLDLIALDHKLKCRFCENCFLGNYKDIKKAQNILINSIKYN